MVTQRFRIPEEQKRPTGRQQDERLATRVGRTLEDWNTAASEALGRNPTVTVVAGIALGVALGWLLKRR